MTEYRSPTTIQQVIPLSAMTPLEIWLLSLIFDAVPQGDWLYFSSVLGPRDVISISKADLSEALAASARFSGTACEMAARALEAHGDMPDPVQIDVSLGWWDRVLQDIVKRSCLLDHISVTMLFPCERLYSDGLGGLVILITATQIRCKSLDDMLMDFLREAEDRGEIRPLG